MKDRIKELIKSGKHEDMIDYAISNLIWVAENFSEAKSTPIATLNELHDIGSELKQALTSKKRPVDMSVFVDSPTDCEFKESVRAKDWVVGNLNDIKGDSFIDDASYYYQYCKPRMNYPYHFSLFGSAEKMKRFAEDLYCAGFNVEQIGFEAIKITGLLGAFCWPWEGE